MKTLIITITLVCVFVPKGWECVQYDFAKQCCVKIKRY